MRNTKCATGWLSDVGIRRGEEIWPLEEFWVTLGANIGHSTGLVRIRGKNERLMGTHQGVRANV